MFRSTFLKYLVAFISIIVVSFIILAGIFTSMMNSYSVSSQDETLRNISKSVEKMVESRQTEDLGHLVKTLEGTGYFDITIAQNPDVSLLLTDEEGFLLLSTYDRESRGGADTDVYGQIDFTAFQSYREDDGECLFHEGKLSIMDSFTENSRIYAYSIEHKGKTIGYSVTMRSTAAEDRLMSVVYRSVLSGSLWVMLAAVIAVYFITERIVHPLREMTRATREYAKGDFTKRVQVYGNDEVSELGVAFNDMADALTKTEKMRNAFLANISHDLRTPMTTISGFIDGITSGAIPEEKHTYYLGVIQAEVHRLSRLVSQILDVSRLESGERKFVFSDFDIAEVARLILISFEQKIEGKKLEVEFISDDSVMVNADKDAIYQVLYNLCHNAIKFAKQGGIFRIKISVSDKNVSVSVYDEGQSIAKEELPFVFDRFYKTDKSRGLDKTGVGLGLYICKTIIDQHKQTIFVTSNEGVDCEFTFTLARSVESK